MSNDLVIHQPQTALAIAPEQREFTPNQVAMLQHIGVENATDSDLQVFFHQCQRTGLDPFARQIYMIGRPSNRNVGGQWVKETKQTIQTGIDGYRLIGRRAAQRANETISVKPPLWAHPDGGWRDVWLPVWGQPAAAKVVILRGNQEFTGVALFDEYKQTKRDGGLTQMWAQRPAGQIAKCAESLAWRMAFPQDLAGIYTEEEMSQADNPPVSSAPAEVVDAEDQASPKITAEDWEQITEGAKARGLDAPATAQAIQQIIGRQIRGWQEITVTEFETIKQAFTEGENTNG